MIDRKTFFAGIRQQPFDGKLSTSQVQGVTVILDEWERRKLTDLRHLSYMLATAKWETAHTMQPITELGSQKYLRGKSYWPWIGRGFVQLTWQKNYAKFQPAVLKLFGADLLKDPDSALHPDVAAYVMFEGMATGAFTGKKLSDYFSATKTDWLNARRIINGTDKAADIATIAKAFFADLTVASS